LHDSATECTKLRFVSTIYKLIIVNHSQAKLGRLKNRADGFTILKWFLKLKIKLD